MEALIVQFASSYPHVASVLMIVGILRAINKPLFALFRAYVAATPSDKDNQLLDQVEKSKVYTALVFWLDYLTSIKLTK